MQPALGTANPEQQITLNEIIAAVHTLPVLDKLRLIRILAEELESAREIFPFQPNKTYYLATPYNSFGAADVLAEAMATDQDENV